MKFSNRNFIALANSADESETLALSNELVLDNEGWALLAPFGEHRKTRTVQRGDQIVTETFVQVFDEASVDAILANDKGDGLFAKLKRALIKRPIFEGHPDIKLYAPETVTMGNEKLVPLGLVDANRKTARGLESRIQLAPQGAEAVEQRGCKFLSGVFLLNKTGQVRADGAIEVRPFKLASIGLTPHPNISGVDSLANANANTPAANQTDQKKNDIMKQLLIGWLAAQGITLANDAADQAVLDAFSKEWLTRTGTITTLGNEKSTLTTTVSTLTADRDAEKKRADDNATALANEQTAFKAERKARCEATVDLVITQGRLALAEREAKVGELTALANDKLDAALTALKALPVKFAVLTALGNERKADANTNTTQDAQREILALANSDPKYKSLPLAEAMAAIKRDKPALFEQLNGAAK